MALWQRIINLPLRWYMLGMLIVATIARLISIVKASIWHDEGYTMMLISHDVVDIIARTARDVHPPLYYILTHWWTMMLGDSELAIRGFSLICGLGVVVLTYFIVKRLKFSETTARLAVLFTALGPFLIRYSQEARMYSMAALLVAAATLAMLIALDNNKKRTRQKQLIWWFTYGLIMAAALYTHYYAVLIIPVHIGFAIWKLGGIRKLIQNKFWWLGNLVAAVLFVPWLPTLISQFTRVQSGFWIPPVDAETIPNTLMQFMDFSSNSMPSSIEMILTVFFACFVAVVIYASKKRSGLVFLASWAFVPLILSILISLKQPVYYDRYFVYSSIAFYIILAVLLTGGKLRTWLKDTLIVLACVTFIYGIVNVYSQANHAMRDVGSFVTANFKPGDVIVSAELYTYFDFSYYNKTGAPVKLLSSGPLSGYGETSLLYDSQQNIVVNSFDDITKNSDQQRVWVVGKTGQHDYYETMIPANWNLLKSLETSGDSAVKLYSL